MYCGLTQHLQDLQIAGLCGGDRGLPQTVALSDVHVRPQGQTSHPRGNTLHFHLTAALPHLLRPAPGLDLRRLHPHHFQFGSRDPFRACKFAAIRLAAAETQAENSDKVQLSRFQP